MGDTTLRLRTQADLKSLLDYAQALKTVRTEIAELTNANKTMATAPGAMAHPGPGQPPGGGHQPPPPPGPQQAPGQPSQPPGGAPAPAGQGGGGGGGRGAAAMGMAVAGGYMAGSMIQRAASGVSQLGLGQSVTGFIMASGQKYLELSKIIEHLDHRFRESEGNVTRYGYALGYVAQESAQLAESLGAQTDSVGKTQFQRYLGAARHAGLDPGTAMERFGNMERLQHNYQFNQKGQLERQALSDDQLGGLMAQASAVGMGQGRFGEFLGGIQQSMEKQVHVSGKSSLATAMGLDALTHQIFEEKVDRYNPATGLMEQTAITSQLGQGAMGEQFRDTFQSVITGGKNQAMESFMLRAIGYGDPGNNMSLLDAEAQLEEGIYNPKNISAMFNQFQSRGYDKEQTERSLRTAGFSAKQTQYLSKNLATPEGLAKFEANSQGMLDEMNFRDTLSGDALTKFDAEGMTGLGKMAISAGEGRSVALEGVQMQVGRYVAEGMVDSTQSMINLAKTFQNLVDMDLGKLFTDVTEAIKNGTAAMERASRPGGVIKEALTLDSATDAIGNLVGRGGGGTIHGQSAFQVQTQLDLEARQASYGEGGGGQ